MSNVPSVTFSSVYQTINQVQDRLATEQGCQAWNWQSNLLRLSELQVQKNGAPLMGGDLVHLTQQGYFSSGKEFATQMPLKP